MGRGRSRPQRNLLTRMDEVTRGPMSVLRNCMINKTRVKVRLHFIFTRYVDTWFLSFRIIMILYTRKYLRREREGGKKKRKRYDVSSNDSAIGCVRSLAKKETRNQNLKKSSSLKQASQ